ncbi:MAG: hypothetical protein QW142_00915 [Candidatus Bathyarchaeia archaeon]
MKTAKRFRANCSGQLLIVAALAIAILIASTSIYVYELTTEKQGVESSSLVELALAVKAGVRNAVISALANITNGGSKTILTENLDALADAYMRLHPQQPCHIRYTLLNGSGYMGGVKITWSEGLGVSSAYILYTLKILGPASSMTINDAVNITTALMVEGYYTIGENETIKTVNLTCKLFNEEKPAHAKNLTIYYMDDSGAWARVNSPSITDWGNGTYSLRFTIVLVSDIVHVSVRMVDARKILVVANVTCSQTG